MAQQASLEGLLDFSAPEALAASQRAQAARTFHMIVDYFRQEEVAAGSSPKYSRFLLVRYTYNFSLSEPSQDIFLRAFFESMNFNIAVGYDPDFTKDADSLRQGVVAFADFLFDNFFLPRKWPRSTLCFLVSYYIVNYRIANFILNSPSF